MPAHSVPLSLVAASFVGLCLLLAWWPACRTLRSADPPESPWMQGLLRFLAVWTPCFAATLLVHAAFRLFHATPDVQPVLARFAEFSLASRLLLVVHGIAVAPFYEEWLFRKWFQDFCVRHAGLRPGIALTALAFALLHFSWSAFLPLIVLALALSLARIRTGSLIPCIVMHALHNATVFLFLILFLGSANPP